MTGRRGFEMLSVTLLVLATIAAYSSGTTGAGRNPLSGEQQVNEEAAFFNSYCKTSVGTTVPSGSETEAHQYYKDLGAQIGLQLSDPSPGESGTPSTLDDVLKYLGYSARASAPVFTGTELQNASPEELMDEARLGLRLGGVPVSAGDVLVARFFAPKISDVSRPVVTDAGWRKLVRMRALSGSDASSHGIDYGIILFNFFASIDAVDPFRGNNSANTQVILVGTDTRKSLFWVDFGPTLEGAKLSHQLNAFFDAGHIPDSASAANGRAAAYHVPCGCISCHGGISTDFTAEPPAPRNRFRSALLDYLDTDHWFDRMAALDDFAGVKAPALFDPGTFEVILMINRDIERQNTAAQPDSVLTRAAAHWLTTHLQQGPRSIPLFDRALRRSTASPIWNVAEPTDYQLLPKLNRYCFRCHGSVAFDVLDKEMVIQDRLKIVAALFPSAQIVDKRAAMPPDRELPPTELESLRNLVLALK